MSAIKQIDFDEIKRLILLIRHYWYIFFAILCVSTSIAFIFNYTTQPKYMVNARILVKDDEKGTLSQIMGINSHANTVNNEIAILKSYELIKKTVTNSPFEVSYFEKSKFRTREIFPNTKYKVTINKQHAQIVGVPFLVQYVSDSSVQILLNQPNVAVYDYINNKVIATVSPNYDTIIKLNSIFKTDFCEFSVNTEASSLDCNEQCFFVINSIDTMVDEFKGITSSIEGSSGVVTLSISSISPAKGAIFINQLIQHYFNHSIQRQNTITDNTLEIVDTLLNTIKDSLLQSEEQLKSFKQKKRVLDIDFQSQKSFGELSEEEKNRASLILKRAYLQRSLQSLQNSASTDALAIPASVDVSDVFLDKLVEEYNSAVVLKKEIKLNTLKDPPYLNAIEVRINNARNALIDAMKKMEENFNFSITEVSKKIGLLYSNIDSIPETSRDLVRIERLYRLHEELYVFLLQKQSETRILKAGNIPVNEILEYARPESYLFLGPHKLQNGIKALFIALALSGGIVYCLKLLNNKIVSSKDIETLGNNTSIFATIFRNTEPSCIVTLNGAHNPVAESFRTLQANFQFLPKTHDKGKICLITSSDMGEGKSFISSNIAYTLATNNKKVALLGLDLRKPSLHTYLGIENTNKGLSSYLSGAYPLNEIIKQTDNNLLHFFNSGPIPPNPTELLNSENMTELIKRLQAEYDYVIIDTPPIGRVGDFLYISKFADAIFYVIRHNHSARPFVKHQLHGLLNKNIQNISIIYNDVPVQKRRYGYYSYGYY